MHLETENTVEDHSKTTTETQAAVSGAERRTQSHAAIHLLVESRNEMLTIYGELASFQPFDTHQREEVLQKLQEFCEALIDYTASAHFQLYRYIDKNKERRTNVREVADRVYPKIVETTIDILDFNDKYETLEKCIDLQLIADDLSHVGEVLAQRTDLEDEVIDALSSKRDRRS